MTTNTLPLDSQCGSAPAAVPTSDERIRAIIGSEEDVRRILELELQPDGRYRYLIETPFETFPKFVIGTVDADGNDARFELACGAEGNARAHWTGTGVAA